VCLHTDCFARAASERQLDTRAKNMPTTPQRYGLTERGEIQTWNQEVQVFLSMAGSTKFEMRYLGEDRWYAAPTDDVALTLAGYHVDLQGCLHRLLNGEELASRLALFRVARRSTET
jgi:hypothetical protein